MAAKWKDVLEIGPQCHERFLYPNKVLELATLDICMAGVSKLEGHYRVGHKNPEYHSVLYTTGGRGLLHTEHGAIEVEANSLMLLPANQPHLFELNSSFWSTTWLAFDATHRWEALNRPQATVEYCDKAQAVCHLMSLMYYEDDRVLRKTSLGQLEYYLTHTLMVPGTRYDQSNRLDALFKDMEDQLHYPWTIEEMSARIHYSAPHLHRLCKAAYGRSPIQQLIFLRMQRAQRLLTHTDWTLAQIAAAVGYQDIFNFSNRFKKSTGYTPGAYRKHGKAGQLSNKQ
jgi:AraC-like DNA-binding protein